MNSVSKSTPLNTTIKYALRFGIKGFCATTCFREFYLLCLSVWYSQCIKNVLKSCGKEIGSTLFNLVFQKLLYSWNSLFVKYLLEYIWKMLL